MKKLFVFMAMALVAATTFVSCSDDDDDVTPSRPLSAAELAAGSYLGLDSMNVGGSFAYNAADSSNFTVVANSDSSISVTIPEQVYPGTVMGKITMGEFTMDSIPYNKEAKVFGRNLCGTNAAYDFVCLNTQTGKTTINNRYSFTHSTDSVTVTRTDDGSVNVSISFKPGNMPFPIVSTFKGIKK